MEAYIVLSIDGIICENCTLKRPLGCDTVNVVLYNKENI